MLAARKWSGRGGVVALGVLVLIGCVNAPSVVPPGPDDDGGDATGNPISPPPMTAVAGASAAAAGSLVVVPAQLDFPTASDVRTLELTTSDGGLLPYQLTASDTWIDIGGMRSGTIDSGGRSIEVRLKAESVPELPAFGSLMIDTPGNPPLYVPLRVGSTPSPDNGGDGGGWPTLEISPHQLDFGMTTIASVFTLRNGGVGSFNYEITTTASWLLCAPSQASNAGEVDQIVVNVNRAALPAGNSEATILITTSAGLTDQVTVVVQQDAPADPPPAPTPVGFWPTSDERLDLMAYVSQAAVPDLGWWSGYPLNYWLPRQLIDVMHVDRSAAAELEMDPADMFAAMVAYARSASPSILLSTTLSGGNARKREHMVSYPNEAIPYEDMPFASYIEPYYDETRYPMVNLGSPTARALFADLIVEEALARGLPVIHLDNFRHPNSGGTFWDWSVSMDFLNQIHTRLHDAGMHVIVNTAVSPFAMSQDDIASFADHTDGMTFEMGFNFALTRLDPAKMRAEIDVYRYWLDRGKLVSVVSRFEPQATGTDATDAIQTKRDQQRCLAAIVMMMRRPGDAMFVSRSFWQRPDDWLDWPARLGAPLNEYQIVGNPPIMTRSFQHGTMTLNLLESVDYYKAHDAVQIVWR